MRLLTIAATAAVACATVVAASSAFAEPARLTDAQYIAANRCLGLMGSRPTDAADAKSLAAFLDRQSDGRQGAVWDMADQARDDGRHAAGHSRTIAIADRDGCSGFVAAAQMTAAAVRPAHAS